ncbi:MAG TPA: hypothetical protein VKT27_06970 [Candidatus Binataceae bacterium]|nr:hypothetical protein [Candidatus Binataceae bacterium]
MNVFTFSPRTFVQEFKRKGYVHVRDGVSQDFLEFARRQLAESLTLGRNEISNRAIKNKKKQYLFELPAGADFLAELMDSISELTDLPRSEMTLSERHMMVYERHAPAVPPLHKDRLATQIAVGIPLDTHDEARIVLIPDCARTINPMDHAIYCPNELNADSPSVAKWNLTGADYPELETQRVAPVAVELPAQAGDVVVFAGSSMYHGRLNSADSAILYLKFNAMRLDPLAEDPATPAQRRRTLAILERKSDEEILASVIELSPRLLRVSRHYTRCNWQTLLEAYVSGEKEFIVSEQDLRLLLSLRTRSTVKQALEHLDVSEGKLAENVAQVRRLAKLGALELLS